MRRWLGVLAIVVVGAACGGDDSSGSVVESPGGLATLTVAEGSLPEGVSADDLSLEVIVDENAEPGMPVVAVQLLPDGLVLTEPAMLTVPLPEALEGGFMAILQSGDSIEFLKGDIIRQDEEVLSFQTPVGHFSVVRIYGSHFENSMTANPKQVSEGQTQGAAVTITTKAGPILMWLRIASDPEGTLRLFTFSPAQPPVRFFRPRIGWGLPYEEGLWNPEGWQDVEIIKVPMGWETSPASSTCVDYNSLSVEFDSFVLFNLTLLERGEPVSKAFAQFLPEASKALASTGQGPIKLLDMVPGDISEATEIIAGQAPSLCTEATAAGSPTTSTTKPPTGFDPEGDGENGESQPVTLEENVPGADVKSVRFESDPSGEPCFVVNVYGDGERASADATNYLLSFDVVGPDGEVWRARAEYFQGEPDQAFVWVGPNRDKLEGATASLVWEKPDTLRVCFDGGETSLAVATFSVTVNVFAPEGEFSDSAEGAGGS